MISRFGFVAVLALLAFGATHAAAQYPSKPIRLVVPFPPGGAAGLAARVVATPLAQGLGQPIIIENKAGADGAIAGDAVLRAAPDGYTLLPNRSALAPEVPTMAEAGLAKLSITPWAGLFGPAKLPREIVDRLAREMKAVMARADVSEQLGRYAFEGQSSSPEEMGAFLKEQLGVWRQTVKDAGIQPD